MSDMLLFLITLGAASATVCVVLLLGWGLSLAILVMVRGSRGGRTKRD